MLCCVHFQSIEIVLAICTQRFGANMSPDRATCIAIESTRSDVWRGRQKAPVTTGQMNGACFVGPLSLKPIAVVRSGVPTVLIVQNPSVSCTQD